MGARQLVIGLDGADLRVIRELGEAELPALFRVMREGAYAALEVVMPPATLPNWTTFLTGVDPGQHGVIDFTTRDENGAVRFTAGSVREAPTFGRQLDALGHAAAIVGFPATWPPERLEHGVFVSGWDSPVAFEADASFVWPPSFHARATARFGPMRFDDVDELAAENEGWHESLSEKLVERVARKAEFFEWILKDRPWTLAAFYFGESDTASHHLWAYHDAQSPRYREGHAQALADVYRALDRAVAKLRAAAGDGGGDDVGITLLSDHGSGGSSDRVLYLNRFLAEQGLLRFHQNAGRMGKVTSGVKDIALTTLPPSVRERLFRFGGGILPSWLETRARFGAISMRETEVYSDELNYFPALWAERPSAELYAKLVHAFSKLVDPISGKQIVRNIWRREDVFFGPYLERAPHYLLDLHLSEDGYSYNVMPSASAPDDCKGWFRVLRPEEHLGRKGRSLPGSHRERGFFAMSGPRVKACGEIDAHIADVHATLLRRLDEAPGGLAMGRVLFEALSDSGANAAAPSFAPSARPLPERTKRAIADPSIVEKRLRTLGYID